MPSHRRSTRTSVTLVCLGLAAGALALAACGSGGGAGSSSGTTTTSTAGATTTTGSNATTSTAGLLAAGQQGTAAQVPWSQVAKGWVLATWQTAAPTGTPSSGPAPTIMLVDPGGGRYDLGPAPAGSRLSGWSGDGKHALLSAGAATTSVTVLGLATHSTTTFNPGGQLGYDEVQFTEPDGLAVIVGGPPDRRLGLNGSVQQTYSTPPATVGAAGQITGGANGGHAETPQGTTLALQASGGIDIVSNANTFVRFLPATVGQTACDLLKWWSASDLLVSCGAQLETQPVAGGAPVPLTSTSTPGTYLDAWTVGTETIVEGGACGTTWLNSVSSSGTVTKLTVPNAGASVRGISATGDRILVLGVPSCDGGASSAETDVLEWYDPSTNQATPILGAGSQAGGWVDTADLFGDPTG